jgi:hypothetical protein
MLRRTSGARPLIALLAAVALVFLVPACRAAEGYGDHTYSGKGTWRITHDTLIGDARVVVNGDIIVSEGAKLLLLDTTLLINCSYPGQYRVLVEPGAQLKMSNSYIIPVNTTNPFLFDVQREPSGWTLDPQAAFIVGAMLGLGVGFPVGIAATAYAYKRWFSRNLPPPV